MSVKDTIGPRDKVSAGRLRSALKNIATKGKFGLKKMPKKATRSRRRTRSKISE